MRYSIAVLMFVAVGCVSQGTYDQLKRQQAQTLQELQQRDAELAQRNQEANGLKRTTGALKSSLTAEEAKSAEMQRALLELRQRQAETEATVAEYRGLIAKFKSMIDAHQLNVRVVNGRFMVVLASDVLFSSGSAKLSKEGEKDIAQVAQVLSSVDRDFQVEGYTDNVPTKGHGYKSNWELASARALNVVATLLKAGMPVQHISAASFGEAHPAASNDTAEGRTTNRRIEISLIPDLSKLPGVEELNKAQDPAVAAAQ